MRLVQLALPEDRVDAILTALDAHGVDHVVTDETSDNPYAKQVTFVLPTEAVEPVLDDLRNVGLTDDAQTVIIDAETVISREYDELEEAMEPERGTSDQIARQELRTRAEDLTPSTPIYVTMTIISAVVATAGLLLDSPAVVVGSMVIAPLIGPALSASVGTVVNDNEMFEEGFTNQILGVTIAILSAALFAWLVRTALLVPAGVDVLAIPEVAERLRPDLLSLFIALGAGVAGVFSLTTGIPAALVGVMIAAALIPPAAAAGVAIAWGEPLAAIGATVLVFVNLVSINLTGLVTLWYSGYRPERFFETSEARRQLVQQVALYGIAAAGLSSFLVASSVTAVRQAAFEEAVDAAVTDVLSRNRYADLELLTLDITFADVPIFADPEHVDIEVGMPDSERREGLSEAIQVEIRDRTDHEVTVRVRFIQVEERG